MLNKRFKKLSLKFSMTSHKRKNHDQYLGFIILTLLKKNIKFKQTENTTK